MIITYYGLEFFRLQFGDTVVAFNPFSKDSKFKNSRFGSDITLISLNHKDFNGSENMSLGDRKTLTISGPGEYEVKNIFIKGALSESNYGGEKKINTIYNVLMEGMSLVFLGPLSSFNKDMEAFEDINEVDVLFIPVGGNDVLNPADASKLSVFLEPKIIIPMHYDNEPKALDTFLKESGAENVKPLDKLTLKKKDLEGKVGDVVVIKNNS